MLMHAARAGHLDVVKYLTEKGADINHVDYAVRSTLFDS